VIISFRAAYAIGQTLSGRLLDRVGTRAGPDRERFVLLRRCDGDVAGDGIQKPDDLPVPSGLGESANWPGATKAVAEWFPRRESGWAVALFDSGSSIGGALAPLIVIRVYKWFRQLAPAFVITGPSGIPLAASSFRALYRRLKRTRACRRRS
jgi:ACS family hexuronate transporter-like MFS transporter